MSVERLRTRLSPETCHTRLRTKLQGVEAARDLDFSPPWSTARPVRGQVSLQGFTLWRHRFVNLRWVVTAAVGRFVPHEAGTLVVVRYGVTRGTWVSLVAMAALTIGFGLITTTWFVVVAGPLLIAGIVLVDLALGDAGDEEFLRTFLRDTLDAAESDDNCDPR